MKSHSDVVGTNINRYICSINLSELALLVGSKLLAPTSITTMNGPG